MWTAEAFRMPAHAAHARVSLMQILHVIAL